MTTKKNQVPRAKSSDRVSQSNSIKPFPDPSGYEKLKSQLITLKLQLEQKTQHENLLLETASQLTASADVKELLERIADGAMRILEGMEADIYLLSEDKKTLTPMIATGPSYTQEILSTPLDIDHSLTGKSIKSGKSAIINDVLHEDGICQIPGTPIEGEERLVIVPLTDDHKVVGALCVSRLGMPFSEEDLSLAEAYGALASTKLKNMREAEDRLQAENELRESETKYRELVDSLPNIIFELDLKGYFTFANRYGFEVSGYTQEDVDKGLYAPNLFHEKDRARVLDNMAKILRGEKIFFQEYTVQKKNGESFMVLANTRPIIRDGKPVGWRGFLEDLTEHKLMEKEIADSEARYRLLTELNPDVIAIHSGGKILYVNPAGVKLLGAQSQNDFVGKPAIDMVAPVYRKIVAERIKDGIQRRQYLPSMEERFLRVDGSEIDVEVTSIPITLDDKPAMLVVAHDITDRKKSERELRESEGRYQTLANVSPVGIFHTRIDGYTTYVNPTWCQISGIAPEEAIGYGWLNAVHPDDRARLQADWSRTINRHSATTADYRFVHADGSLIWVIGKAVPELDADNNVLGYVGTITDITDRIKDQEVILRSNNDLIAAYEATLDGWSHALEIRERDTAGHCKRVADLTVDLARRLGVPESQLIHIRRGAILHDIGKMAIPDRILLKPEPLTNEEWVIMRQHPIFARELLSSIEYLVPALDIPVHHHEHFDGSGYPYGLKGDQIPLAVRIFSVVDEWDALTSDRPYRRAWTRDAARRYVLEQKGKEFDPGVVDEFIKGI